MKIAKAILCVLIVSLLVSMAIPMASAGKPDKPPGKPPKDEPPADPAIVFYDKTSGPTPTKIFVMNDDGSNKAIILEGNSEWDFTVNSFSWSPDGGSLAWSGETFVPYVPSDDYGVWRMDVEVIDGVPQGSNLQQLAVLEYTYRGCAWSPLGHEITVASRSDPPSPETGGLANQIFVVPATGGTPEVIYTGPDGTTGIRTPVWSSDGTRIAFAEVEMSTGEDYIKIMDRATGEVTHILMKGLFMWMENSIGWLDWARQDSDTLVFHAAGMIYTVDIDSGTPVPVVEGSVPSWSPDNSKIVYVASGKKRNISTYEFSTGDITALTKGGRRPDWRRF